MEAQRNLLPYDEVLNRLGISKRTLNIRVLTEGVTTWIDGRDRRRRLIDERDLPKLTETRPAPRRAEQAAA